MANHFFTLERAIAAVNTFQMLTIFVKHVFNKVQQKNLVRYILYLT